MLLALFGGRDPVSPRGRVLVEGLEALGAAYADLRVDRGLPLGRRWRALRRNLDALGTIPEWLLVTEFAHKDVPLAWFLCGARGMRLAFDPLVSRYDMLVEDWGLYARGGLEAWWNRRIDGWTVAHADLVACDTAAHGQRFRELGAARAKLVRVPVGAEERFWQAGERRGSAGETPRDLRAAGALRVLYVGGFLPFHGVPVIVEAARRLAARGLERAIHFRLVGEGVQFAEVRAALAQEPVANLELAGARPQAEMTGLLAQADVSLGCFARAAKTERVVPHKVVQSLAAGVCVATAVSPAMAESFTDGEHYAAVPAGDAEALAEVLAGLAREPARRARLARAGRERARRERTPAAVARAWLVALAAAGGRGR